jgi:hypothetical protein
LKFKREFSERQSLVAKMSVGLNPNAEKKAGNAKRDAGDSNRVIVGNSDNGGAANANWNHPDNSNDNLGFRLAVVFFPTKGSIVVGCLVF